MLTRVRLVAALALLPLVGCGSVDADSGPEPVGSSDVCAQLSKEPSVTGDGKDAAPRATVTTSVEAFDRWLAGRARQGAPEESSADFPQLAGSAELTECVFEVDARPIPAPPGSKGDANGVSVLVGSKGWFVYEIGPLATILGEVRELQDVSRAK